MPYKDKEAQRAYQKEWLMRRKQTWIDENGPCKQCGTWEDLEIDHIDRVTKISHRIWSWTEARRLEELAKCQILCYNCHIIKGIQVEDILPRGMHGTITGYQDRKCRCSECLKWRSDYYYLRKSQGKGKSS